MNITKIAVVGAGQMGRGVAQVAAFNDFDVYLYDVSTDSLDKAEGFIQKQLDRGVSKGKWEQSKVDSTMGKIKKVSDLNAVKDAHLVIEAATENKEIKFKIFKQLDEVINRIKSNCSVWSSNKLITQINLR